MTKAQLRSKVLTVAGGSWPVTFWSKLRGKAAGVLVRRIGSDLLLQKDDRGVLLAAKHSFFSPEVAAAFEVYSRAIPVTERNGLTTADFASSPAVFNNCRWCLQFGVVVQARDGGFWLRKDTRAIIIAERHFIYARDLAHDFDRYFAPLVPEMREGLEVIDFSQAGKLQTYRVSGLQFEMASFPEEEDELEESFRWYRPKVGDLVFDIGAHCGVSTYHLSEMVGPAGKVVAFEPDPVNFAILQRNMARYAVQNVELVPAAVAATAGRLEFSSEGTVGSMLMSVLRRPSEGEVVTVEAMTLADAFGRWGVPNLCKIDIEGAEIDVIEKSADLLRTHKTNFSLDTCHLKADGTPTNTDIEALFRSYGYEVESDAKPLMATWARPLPHQNPS
jgi:FkbM family methyltransferase